MVVPCPPHPLLLFTPVCSLHIFIHSRGLQRLSVPPPASGVLRSSDTCALLPSPSAARLGYSSIPGVSSSFFPVMESSRFLILPYIAVGAYLLLTFYSVARFPPPGV